MAILRIEKVGGIAGYGGSSRLRSRGELDTTELSDADLEAVESLFQSKAAAAGASAGADRFQVKLTRTIDGGTETIVAPEEAVPQRLLQSVRDEIV
jgi:hypothetical protein